MYCTECGTPIPQGYAFCTGCGCRIEAQAYQVPVYEVPAASPAVFPASLSAPKVILLVFLSLLLFIFSTLMIALTVISPQNIVSAIPQVNVVQVIEQLDLTEDIEARLQNSKLSHIGIEDFNDFLALPRVADEVEHIISEYMDAIVSGDLDFHLRTRDIIGTIEAVERDIEREFGYQITQRDYELITETLNDRDIIDLRDFSVAAIVDEAGIDPALPYLLLSSYPLLILIVLCFIVLLNMFLIHRRKLRTFFLNAGITVTVLGLIYIGVGLIFGRFSYLFNDNVMRTVTRAASGLTDTALITGIICFMAGVILITLYFVIKKVRNNPTSESHVIVADKSMAWNLTGLSVNIAALITCAVFAVLMIQNMP